MAALPSWLSPFSKQLSKHAFSNCPGAISAVMRVNSRDFSTNETEAPNKYKPFVDFTDGYSYFYPSDWRRTIDGKNYLTFEYELESSGFARTAFATIAIGNGRYYTFVVGENQRRSAQGGCRLFQNS